MTFILTLTLGVGCASKNDGLGGSGGASQSGGAPGTGGVPCDRTDSCGGTFGTGGLSQSGGAPGTGGGTGGADPSTLQAALTAAEATWAAAKTSCPDYVYTSHKSSVFGSCSNTTVEIANDQPTRRSYVSCAFVPDGGTVDQWSEVGAAQIGTHNEGASAATVEQLFSSCQAILSYAAANPPAFRVSLAFNAQGVPLACLSTTIQCVDDCTGGLDISAFACNAPDGTDAGHD